MHTSNKANYYLGRIVMAQNSIERELLCFRRIINI